MRRSPSSTAKSQARQTRAAIIAIIFIALSGLILVSAPAQAAGAQPFSSFNKEAIQKQGTEPQVQPALPGGKPAREQIQQQPPPPPALEARCRQYAQNAVRQSEYNRAKGCGFTGRRWTSDYQEHFRWCLGASETSVNFEIAERSVGLAPCSYCVGYAESAVDANERNRLHGCGFTGTRWTSNYQAHLAWCKSTPQWIVGREWETRRPALAQCSACAVTEEYQWSSKPETAKCSYCAKYTDQALAANKENVEYRCNLSGARWSADRGGHFRWCMASRESSVEQEARHRNFDSRKCAQCTFYARAAVTAQQDNINQKCLFTGPEWSSDYGAHFRWCWNTNDRPEFAEITGAGELSNERAKRWNAVAQCRALRGVAKAPARKLNPQAVQRR